MISKYIMDVYPRTLYVAVNESEQSISDYLNGNSGDDIPEIDRSGNAYSLPVTDGKNGGVLIRFKSKEVMTPGIIAHECFHAVMRMCSYLGINFDEDDNNEHVAYMIEWAVDKVFEFKKNNF